MWWYAYWYLVRARKTWDVIWIDPSMLEKARAKLESTYGALDGFEPIEGVQPLHVEEILNAAHCHIKLPARKRGQRRRCLERIEAVQ